MIITSNIDQSVQIESLNGCYELLPIL